MSLAFICECLLSRSFTATFALISWSLGATSIRFNSVGGNTVIIIVTRAVMQFSPSGSCVVIIILREAYTGHRTYLCVQRVHHFTDLLEGIDSSAIRVLPTA